MTDSLLTAFRHDIHKFMGKSHENARQEFDGIPVNQTVPKGADYDAAALSRPNDTHKQTVKTHRRRYRISILTGKTDDCTENYTQSTIENEVVKLVGIKDAKQAHKRWLTSDMAARFNESVYYPYTSLKYHTLLVAALLDNYNSGNSFDELRLIVDPAGEIIPCRTIFDSKRFSLRIGVKDNEHLSSRLGNSPWRSWASVWNRLTTHPLNTDKNKYDMFLDANLRRIQSWSTALQYIEDYAEWRPDQ